MFILIYNTICTIFWPIDVTRHTRSVVDYSGRIGGKPFLDLPGSLSVPNIGERTTIHNNAVILSCCIALTAFSHLFYM